MYKNLSRRGLGISGRQSELIELALTYGFRGVDLDIEHFVKQTQRRSVEHARRFIDSAKSFADGFEISSWQLPTRWKEDEETFKQDLNQLEEIAEIAGQVDALRCDTTIEPASDSLAYHENFELHRERLGQIADALAKHNIRLGLDFRPTPEARADKAHQFIHESEGLLTLCKTIGASNVGIVLDTWKWYIGGGGMEQLQDLTSERLIMLRLGDVPAEADLSQIKETDRILPGGDGLIDFEPLAKLLVEIGYDGPVTPFPHAKNFVGKTREVIVQMAADAAEGFWVAAGLSEPPPGAPEPAAVGASVNGEADDGDDGDKEKKDDSSEG